MTPVRAVLISLLIVVFAPSAAHAQVPTPTPTPAPAPQPQEQRIAQGVFAGGVDLSNLTIPEAEAKLHVLDAPLAAPVRISVADHHFTITAKQVKFAFDALRTAKRAYYAGVNDPPSAPAGGGAAAQLNVPLAVGFRHGTVKRIVEEIDRRVYQAPHDATLTITVRKLIKRRSRPGRDLDGKALRASVEATLADPAAPRLLKPGRKSIRAAVNANDLARRFPTVITIEKATFKLRLFKGLKLSKTYGVAIGQPAYPTPSGRFSIQNKQVNPTWTAPNSPWAGELAGQSVSGSDPTNPLKARWMGVANGVGIHGTGQPWSIGSAASHGCLRMRVPDVIDLYPRVPVGTPVLIK
jgi:lipoprotein-anchoring transpeptidase ErfK/SrfK